MSEYRVPERDIAFVLNEVLKVSEADIPGYEDLEADLTGAIVEEAGKLASAVLAPLNLPGDQEGCCLENGAVYTPKGFKEAFDELRRGGWTALDFDPEYGGQGMPFVLGAAINEIFESANLSLRMYSSLTHGACKAIQLYGTQAQKQKYLPKMISCEWTGTMNLTESNCGTDLGLMRTKAEPQDDGTYKISGTKIFISSGDHDLAENIIHLVLAKIPGGPEGIKGVSLFIVPKLLVQEDGSLGAGNGVSVGSLEHKMGIHANSTCVLNYDGATGYLLSEPHKGMRAMFSMMNEMRMDAGQQGYAIAEAAYQSAVAYAHERLQGRAATGAKNPNGPADPLIVHPDVRRMLMDQKSFIEGARAFLYWCAVLEDRHSRNQDADAEGLLSLLTPVIKAFLTDKGYESATNAQQVFGGHGYIEEWGMSQFVRDARIAMIYEGANGIQALDLVGRKLPIEDGKQATEYGVMIKNVADRLSQNGKLGDIISQPLLASLNDFQSARTYLMQNLHNDREAALSGSTDFLHLLGHLSLGYVLALSAEAAQQALDSDADDPAFYQQKLLTVRHYFARHLPATHLHLKRIQAGPDTVMGPDASAF